jgi:hypothetical protein
MIKYEFIYRGREILTIPTTIDMQKSRNWIPKGLKISTSSSQKSTKII